VVPCVVGCRVSLTLGERGTWGRRGAVTGRPGLGAVGGLLVMGFCIGAVLGEWPFWPSSCCGAARRLVGEFWAADSAEDEEGSYTSGQEVVVVGGRSVWW